MSSPSKMNSPASVTATLSRAGLRATAAPPISGSVAEARHARCAAGPWLGRSLVGRVGWSGGGAGDRGYGVGAGLARGEAELGVRVRGEAAVPAQVGRGDRTAGLGERRTPVLRDDLAVGIGP